MALVYIGDDLGADPPTPAEPDWLEGADAAIETGAKGRLEAEWTIDEIERALES